MVALAHALVAGAISTKTTSPTSIILLNLGQHFILDSIPHWDWGTNWRNRPKWLTGIISVSETIFAITVTYLLFQGKANHLLLLLGIIVSLLPDWLETPWYIFFASKSKTEPAKNAGFWEKLCYKTYIIENRFHSKAQLPFGLITEVLTVIFFLVLLK
jgi:hypothetical protein